ncbi:MULTISPECIES: hypothetical protein [unclassified Bradyrhizobium]|uniref:hypothetical protein n=1 Tax=unclassified Bradyrhizobium TaxID=2631580 RepID=UPI002916AC47|nr:MULTISPECIES: hypothetical protein [unclassified Bradyrhizobium]
MKPLSQHMTDLIAIAEDIVRPPEPMVLPKFDAVAAEIRRIDALPAEDERCTHCAMAMIDLIEGLRFAAQRRSQPGISRTPWLMLIGAALPLLRAEAYRQFVAEKELARG